MPERGPPACHPHALLLGAHAQLHARQQQPLHAGGWCGRDRWAPARRFRAGATTRSWTAASYTRAPGGRSFVPCPDFERPPPQAPNCAGGLSGPGDQCLYRRPGHALIYNTYGGNGFFGNPVNGDFAESTKTPATGSTATREQRRHLGPGDQLAAESREHELAPRSDRGGAQPRPAVRQPGPVRLDVRGPSDAVPGRASYPRSGGKVILHALPAALATMANPAPAYRPTRGAARASARVPPLASRPAPPARPGPRGNPTLGWCAGEDHRPV